MSKVLTVQNAEIHTAAVEVKTLTIKGKQVTLAVFRQLEDEDLLCPASFSLAGVPWGRVNYHPDGCKEDREHIHVVWQKGNELRRAMVDWEWPNQPAYSYRAERAWYPVWFAALMASVLSVPLDETPVSPSGEVPVVLNGKEIVVPSRVASDFARDKMSKIQNIRWETKWGRGKEDPEYLTRIVQDALDTVDRLIPAAEEASEATRCGSLRWRKCYGSLLDLPQLFIAV